MGAKQTTVATPKGSTGEAVQTGEETLTGGGLDGSGANTVAEVALDTVEPAADAAAACDSAVRGANAVAEVTSCAPPAKDQAPAHEPLHDPADEPAATASAEAAVAESAEQQQLTPTEQANPVPDQEPTPAAGSEAPAGPPLEDGAKEGKEVKVRSLEQLMSLKPGDDERTEISKKLSWILRHGAKKVPVEIDAEGWVRITDLIATDILSGVSKDRLLEIIDNSNAQKTRYELKDCDDDQFIRAISKDQRRSERSERADRLDRPDRGDRRERRRDGDGHRRQERHDRADRNDRRDRIDQDDRGERPMKGRSKGPDHDRDHGAWWDREQQGIDGPRPGDETTRPGRKGDGPYPEHRGKGIHDGKGDRKGKGKLDKGCGKGVGESGRDHGDGDGWKGGGRNGGRGAGPREDMPPRRKYWRVIPRQDAIVRDSVALESTIVGNIMSGTLVVQIGEDKVLKNGVVRMMVEAIEPQTGIKGWVTRSAEAAGGPIYFKPDRNGKDRNMEPRGGHGKSGPAKGGDRRPVGEGKGADCGEFGVE